MVVVVVSGERVTKDVYLLVTEATIPKTLGLVPDEALEDSQKVQQGDSYTRNNEKSKRSRKVGFR